MGRKSTRENKNIYQCSRENAGLSRQAASEAMVYISADRIEKFALLTECSEEERRRLYDLAGHDRGTVSEDVGEYLRDNSYLVAALRTAKKLNADESDWAHMLNELKKRKGV